MRSFSIKKFVRENRLLSSVIVIEILILATMLLRAITSPLTEISLDGSVFEAVGSTEVIYTGDSSGTYGADEADEFFMKSTGIAISSGAYEFVVEYETDAEACDDEDASYAVWTSEENSISIKSSKAYLTAGSTSASSRFWVRLGSSVDDLRLRISYNGDGSLFIKSVSITESRIRRFTRIAGLLLLFIAADLVYAFFGKNNLLKLDTKKKEILVLLALITFAASITYFSDALFYPGTDLDFHLSRISYLADAIKDGLIPQHIQFTANNGYGYATPLFYPELLLYIPALLYCLWVPLQTCYQIFAVLVNALTCGISYWTFKKVSGSRKLGVIGSCMYTLSAYRMINMMSRGALGEYTAMIFLPLVCYGFWYIYTKNDGGRFTLRECLPLIIGLSGVVQTHTLTLLMCIYFTAALVIICARLTFGPQRFIALAKSAIITLLLNLWYLVPMLVSMATLDLYTFGNTKTIEMRGAYLLQIFGVFQTYSGQNVDYGLQGEMPITLGITLTLGLVLWVFCLVRRRKDKWDDDPTFKQATLFAVFALAACFLSSNLFWSDNPAARSDLFVMLFDKFQFPWRFLAMATVFSCFLAVLCLKMIMNKMEYSSRAAVATAAVLLIPGMLSYGLYVTQYADASDAVTYYTSPDHTDYLYLPDGSDDGEAIYYFEALTGEGVTASEVIYDAGTYTLECENLSDTESYVTFPVFDYDNYHAYDAAGTELETVTGENGRVQVSVPAGYEGTIELCYEVPALWHVCEGVSLAALIGTAVCVIVSGRRRKKDDTGLTGEPCE